MNAANEIEYEICQRRGHEPSGVSMTMGWVTWQRCRWCNTEYRIGEPAVIERDEEFEMQCSSDAFIMALAKSPSEGSDQ